MEEINASIYFDHKLYRKDIEGSFARVAMLAQTEIVSQSDYEKIVHGLKLIHQEIEDGTFIFSRKLEKIFI